MLTPVTGDGHIRLPSDDDPDVVALVGRYLMPDRPDMPLSAHARVSLSDDR
jgi:hypothetical protein